MERLPGDQYRLLVDHAPVMIWRSGLSAGCDYFNDAWLSFTGRALSEELGDGWAKGVHPEDLERCVTLYLAHFERREPFEMEYRLRRHDGVYRTIFDRGVPFEDDAGRFAGFIGSCIDVHERREMEHAKSMFLSMVAHELRTPLTSLKALVTMVWRSAQRGEPIAEDLLRRADVQVGRLTSLIQDISDAAQLDLTIEPSMTMADLDLAALVRDLADTYEATFLSRAREDEDKTPRHTLTRDLPEGPCPMRGDAHRIEQAIANIVNNAVKYSPRGGDISIFLRRAAEEHVVRVADSGIGIPAEELAHICRRYYRASNASGEHYPGMGIGLALTREIIERHGGKLAIESTLGAGTVVTCVLPVRSAPAAGARS